MSGASAERARVIGWLAFLALVAWRILSAQEPPPADYCSLLARDIAGKQHGFLGGNHLYYIGGQCNDRWGVTEHETLGFTHPMFRDGRARGHGIVTGPGGTGHDKWGWEFWRHVRVAYGSVVVNGRVFRHPAPARMVWRPDRQVCRYEVGGATIREVKFISLDDVLCTIIESDRPVTLEFSGRPFFVEGNIPTHDGDPPGVPFMRKTTARVVFHPRENLLQILEGGRVMTKPAWGKPAVEGRLMYDGMSGVLAASQDIGRWLEVTGGGGRPPAYRFRLECGPGRPVVLAYAMGEDFARAAARVKGLLADPRRALEAKTLRVNDLLNNHIPFFRCSDPAVVRTYYYLWSLYFLYFTHTGEGWEQYPHTQTAVNNFMGLHLWDSWAYAAMGAWVVDKWEYAFGNILSWKFMVPLRNKANALPDNFGIAWYSPGVWMNFVGTVELAWQNYEQSGDRRFLAEAYDDLYRKLYWDGPQPCFGIEINALDALAKMADALGREADVAHWRAMRPALVARFKKNWQARFPHYYAPRGARFKDIWHLASMLCGEMPDRWAEEMVEHWVMNEGRGFLGPVPLRIRPPDAPRNGPFEVSTISTWLAIEGMFRHHCDDAAIRCTLDHLRGMIKDYGYPVAPECWDRDYKPWGSMYYNWCGAMNALLLGRIAGVRYSIPEQTLTLCDHLPPSWDWLEVRVPIVVDGQTLWARARVSRREKGGRVEKTVEVEGCPLRRLAIEPWLEGREVVASEPQPNAKGPRGHLSFALGGIGKQTVRVTLGATKDQEKTR